MQHVVMFSGGLLSWAAAKRVVNRHGTANTILLFTDTLVEAEDLYRFLREAAANVGARLITSDLYSTLGQRRRQFENELERLAMLRWAAVVVEADWREILFAPPEHSQLPPRSCTGL